MPLNRRGFFASLFAPLIARCAPKRVTPKLPIPYKTGTMNEVLRARGRVLGIRGRRSVSFTVPTETWARLFPGPASEKLWLRYYGATGLYKVDSITWGDYAVTVHLSEIDIVADALNWYYPEAPMSIDAPDGAAPA